MARNTQGDSQSQCAVSYDAENSEVVLKLLKPEMAMMIQMKEAAEIDILLPYGYAARGAALVGQAESEDQSEKCEIEKSSRTSTIFQA